MDCPETSGSSEISLLEVENAISQLFAAFRHQLNLLLGKTSQANFSVVCATVAKELEAAVRTFETYRRHSMLLHCQMIENLSSPLTPDDEVSALLISKPISSEVLYGSPWHTYVDHIGYKSISEDQFLETDDEATQSLLDDPIQVRIHDRSRDSATPSIHDNPELPIRSLDVEDMYSNFRASQILHPQTVNPHKICEGDSNDRLRAEELAAGLLQHSHSMYKGSAQTSNDIVLEQAIIPALTSSTVRNSAEPSPISDVASGLQSHEFGHERAEATESGLRTTSACADLSHRREFLDEITESQLSNQEGEQITQPEVGTNAGEIETDAQPDSTSAEIRPPSMMTIAQTQKSGVVPNRLDLTSERVPSRKAKRGKGVQTGPRSLAHTRTSTLSYSDDLFLNEARLVRSNYASVTDEESQAKSSASKCSEPLCNMKNTQSPRDDPVKDFHLVAQLQKFVQHDFLSLHKPEMIFDMFYGVSCVRSVDQALALTRLFYAIGSPDAFQQLRQALSLARDSSTTHLQEPRTSIKTTMAALDILDSSSFRSHILRRYYLVRLLEYRLACETTHKSSRNKLKFKRRLKYDLERIENLSKGDDIYDTSNTPQRKSKSRHQARTDSLALQDMMAILHPECCLQRTESQKSNSTYRKKLERLKARLTCARTWYQLQQTFSLGILALIPCGGRVGVSIDQIEKLPMTTVEIFLNFLKEKRGEFLLSVAEGLSDRVFHILERQSAADKYRFEQMDEEDLVDLPLDGDRLRDSVR